MPPPAGEGRDRSRGTNRSARDRRPRTSFSDRSEPLLQTYGSQQGAELFDRGRQAPEVAVAPGAHRRVAAESPGARFVERAAVDVVRVERVDPPSLLEQGRSPSLVGAGTGPR